mgnify:CR=1 FL=1
MGLDQNKLTSLAQTQWEYNIYLYERDKKGSSLDTDPQQLNSLREIETGSNFEIVVAERWSLIGAIPNDILEMGSIGSREDHIQIETSIGYERIRTNAMNMAGTTYIFKDVPAGTLIKLRLTPDLQSRLDHPSGIITINVH